MNSVHNLELTTTYDKSKFVVKQWENRFKKAYGRLPSKLDIKEANREVRHAYKTYFRLKTAALEESLSNIDGFDVDIDKNRQVLEDVNTSHEKNVSDENTDVEISNKVNTKDTWGSHLSNIQKSTNNEINQKSVISNLNLSFTNKLFQGLKTAKRFPRKSLSFNRKKSDLESSKPRFFSQPDSSCVSSLEVDSTCSTHISDVLETVNSNVKIVSSAPVVLSQPVDIIQNAFKSDNQQKPLMSVDRGWIERLEEDITHETNDAAYTKNDVISTATEVNYDSDNIIDNSDDDDNNSCSLYHVAKKRRVSSTSGNENRNRLDNSSNNLVTVDILTKRLDFSNIFNSNLAINIANSKAADSKQSEVSSFKQHKIDEAACAITNSQYLKNNKKNVRKCVRIRKTESNAERSDTENEDPYHSDDNDQDEDFVLENEYKHGTNSDVQTETNTKNTTKQRRNKNKHVTESRSSALNERSTQKQRRTKVKKFNEKTNCDQKSYELEYSIKPRIVTVPRINNIKQAISKKKEQSVKNNEKTLATAGLVNNQTQIEKKLQQKIDSGTLNDNYVQINLKKKIYVRGRKTKSFSNYKKQMWKKQQKSLYGPNMDMGGCDGGMLTCFNCGKTGHFARACKLSKGDQLRPLEEGTEECVNPTLEEAAKMAKESALSIRKPNSNHACKTDLQVETNNTETNLNSLFNDEEDRDLLEEVERLEVEIAQIEVQKYIDTTVYVKPYYSLATNDSLIDTPQEVFDALQLFGHQVFRAGQEQAVMRILSGKSTLVTLSTGSGKSLCYQLPAYLYSKKEPCISLIISPLVSLMEDQVTGIPIFLKAACLHTNQTKTQREKVMDAIKTGSLNILLVSPEAVVSGESSSGFGSLLRQLPPIAFACIDEVHCVSHWSHNFRPSYLKICKVLRDRLGVRTILGLTATATRATCDSIIEHLNITDGRCGHISDIPLPSNLRLTVSKDEHRDQALLGLILSEPFASYRSIIVYCTRREDCQRVATFLRTYLKDGNVIETSSKKRKRRSFQAECYHAGLSASRRKTIQKSFMSGELRIVVATVAFGMGINKADIRSVIHYNMPMSFERYVQEVGRAGRDGLMAHCHLFLDAQGNDENELRKHIYANSIDWCVIRKLIDRCFVPCSCKSTCPRHEVAFSIQETVEALDIPEENIETLLCYLELHEKRYIELLSHAYVTCKVISYSGPNEINKASKHCAPLAMALALYKKEEHKSDNIFEFPVVEVASAMGWDSGICKHILKNLEWVNENNQPRRSNLSIQFSNLGFRLLSPGNLPALQLNEALDNLYKLVKEQEETSLLQLHAVHATLTSAAAHSFRASLVENKDKETLVKTKIREYFESPKSLCILSEINTLPVNEEQIKSDVRTLINMYRDNSFNARAVARIFYGIQSPNYPAIIWKRCKFWRLHIGTDFNTVYQIATKEIKRLRNIE